MNKNLNNDKQLREKLDGFSVQPPPFVWDNVQGQLAVQQRKKRLAYFGWISAAAVVMLAFLAGWYFNNNSEIVTSDVAQQQIVQPEIEAEKGNINKENILSAELADNQQSDNENIKDESALNKSSLLLATSNKLVVTEEKKISVSKPEQIEMERLISLEAQFNLKLPEMLLAENSIQKNDYSLTESDKFVMAVNVGNGNSKNTIDNTWKMGMHISPGYSSHTANHSENYSQNMNYSGENGSGNIGGGFSVQYKTSKKLSVESGVYYAQNGQKSSSSYDLFSFGNREYDKVYAPNSDYQYLSLQVTGFSNAVNISNGNVSMNSTAGVIEMRGTPKGAEISTELEAINSGVSNTLITNGEFSQVFDFIEIPLYLRYSLIDSKLGLEVLGGLNAGFVVGNNAYIDNSYGLQNIGKTQDISTINLSGTVGVGVNYALGKHISVAVEPRLNYYFNSINNSPEVDYRPYRIGVFTGLYYEF